MKARTADKRLRLYASLSLLAVVSLDGCAHDTVKPEPPQLAQQDIPPQFQVRAKVAHHPLLVMSATGEISSYERQNLDGFLANLALGNPQALHVRVSGLSSPDAKAQVIRLLVADGIEPSKIEFMAGGGTMVHANNKTLPPPSTYQPDYRSGGPSAYGASVKVDVAAEIYSVVPPSCPRLSRVGIVGNDNGMASNWGCSTVSVFEQMVADPRDLVHGESGGTTDSEVTSGAIERMRKDKTKLLQDYGSVTLGSGGGGS